MAMNENIVKGMKYRIATDDTGNNWDRLSLWTAAEDVEFEDEQTLAQKIALINTAIQALNTTKQKYETFYTGTLTAGQTTLTITNSAIKADDKIDIYVNVYGVAPKTVVVSNGSVVMTFEAQDVNVGVQIRRV